MDRSDNLLTDAAERVRSEKDSGGRGLSRGGGLAGAGREKLH